MSSILYNLIISPIELVVEIIFELMFRLVGQHVVMKLEKQHGKILVILLN